MKSFVCRSEAHSNCDGGALNAGIDPVEETRCMCECHDGVNWESFSARFRRRNRLKDLSQPILLPLITIYGRDRRSSDPLHFVFRDTPPGVGRIYRPRA